MFELFMVASIRSVFCYYRMQVLAKELLTETDEMCDYAVYILGLCGLYACPVP